MHTYNLFRRKGAADLFCAVPQDVPVPNFVTAVEWEYARPLDVGTLSAFDAAAAETSAAANGFYLFHSAP
jgi:hypothetical protein